MGHISERVAFEGRTDEVVALFAHRPSDWLIPFLRIAAAEADATGLAATELARRPGARSVSLDLGPAVAVPGAADTTAFAFTWRTTGYRTFVGFLHGRVTVRPAPDGRVEVALHAAYRRDDRSRTGAADRSLELRRAAVTGVRSLLGHLRTAIEEAAIAASLDDGGRGRETRADGGPGRREGSFDDPDRR